ncbi:MAG: hypothetical protein OXF75_05060 [Acidimicrobiaceae bacterium]|nr:hypothetical protein [Acidimicrobiaceae bacterium]
MSDPGKIVYFLILFDRDVGEQVGLWEFTDSTAAVAAYTAEEEKYVSQPHMDIVLLGSSNIETVQKTHGNYFESDTDWIASLDTITDLDALSQLSQRSKRNRKAAPARAS